MFSLSLLLVYINYLIPNKNLLLQNIPTKFNKSFLLIIELLSNIYEIFLVIFIIFSIIIILILLIGTIYRLYRIAKRSTKIIDYK